MRFQPVIARGRRPGRARVFFAVISGFSAFAWAQDPPLYEFGEVVVTAEVPRAVEEVTGAEVVTAEEIARAGARSLDEAIALLPGVFVRRGAEGVPLIDIRGLRTRNVLLLLDGVPLNSSFDALFDPATLAVESIAQIKLTRGAASTLYGPGGNGGVLNIVTRAAGESLDGSLRLDRGLSESSNVRGRVSLRQGDLGMVFAGSFFDQAHHELPSDFTPTALEDGGRRLASDRRDTSAFASLTLDRPTGPRLGLNLNYRAVERGKPPITLDSRQSDFAPRARFERADQEAVSIHAALTHEIDSRWTVRPALYLNRNDELTDAFDDAGFATQSRPGSFREDATTRSLGGGLQVALRPGRRSLSTLALDLREESWEAEGFLVAGGGGGGGGGKVDFADRRSVRLSSLSLEHEISPGGRFRGVVGAGYAAQRRASSASDEGFTFLLGGSWALGEASTLRGSIARQIRFPTLRDLYGTDRGNPELDAEQTLNYEIGISRRLAGGDAELELTVFRIDADDFIERVPGDVLRNFQKTRLAGAELEGRHRLAGRTRIVWSYAYLDAENRSPAATIPTTQNRPEHKATLVTEHDTRSGIRIRGELLRVADSYALSRRGPSRALELGDYTVFSAGLTLPLFEDRLRLLARGDNLTDEVYSQSIGFPAPGRTILLGIELRSRR